MATKREVWQGSLGGKCPDGGGQVCESHFFCPFSIHPRSEAKPDKVPAVPPEVARPNRYRVPFFQSTSQWTCGPDGFL